MREIRILLVDDHILFRESLSRLLEAEVGFCVVGQCASIAEASAADAPADVVLLDYDLGEEQGTRKIVDFIRQRSSAKFLMVTAGMSDETTLRVMETGALGVFLKHSSPDQLVEAIRSVASGKVWLDAGVMRSLIAGTSHRAEQSESARPLTLRQREVLRGILDGLTNKEIASRLGSSESSIKASIQELFQKAGVRSRSQLVRIAIEGHSNDWLKENVKD
jgi:DNA-binding NarL/FixJ family response regulator